MSHDDLDASDREALALLRSLRSEPPAPNAAMANVMQRLAKTLPAAAWTANESGNSSPTLDVPRHAGTKFEAAGHALRSGAVAVTRPWTWAIGLTLAGGITGGALHAAFTPEKVRVVYVDRQDDGRRAAPSPRSTAIDEGTIAAIPSSEPAPLPSDVNSSPNGSGPKSASPIASSIGPIIENAGANASTWAKERTLVDDARRSLASGDPEKSLAQLGKHARTFPSGKLAEERDALVVNALVSIGRYREARQKADAFARRYPHSFLAPSVEGAIAAIPSEAP